jgi:hypothetical protein
MARPKNVPYVKRYNKEGDVANPISAIYEHDFPNRRERREKLNQVRFHGESKNFHLTVVRTVKFHRWRQFIALKDKKGRYTGEVKTIEHYLPR